MTKHTVVFALLMTALFAVPALAERTELRSLRYECSFSSHDAPSTVSSGKHRIYHCGTMPDGSAVYTLNANRIGSPCIVSPVSLNDTSDNRPVSAFGYFFSRPRESVVEVGSLLLLLGEMVLFDTPADFVWVSVDSVYAKREVAFNLFGGTLRNNEGESISCSVTLH